MFLCNFYFLLNLFFLGGEWTKIMTNAVSEGNSLQSDDVELPKGGHNLSTKHLKQLRSCKQAFEPHISQ